MPLTRHPVLDSFIHKCRNSPKVEFLIWGGMFFLFKLILSVASDANQYFADELTFSEGALSTAQNALYTGDFVHGPVIYYLLLCAQSIFAAGLLITGRIHGPADFAYYYAANPELIWGCGRVLMALCGALMITFCMLYAYKLSASVANARITALLLLSMPLFHHAAWYIKEDLWAALLVIMAGYCALSGWSPVLVGIIWGVSVATKLTAGILGPPLFLLIAFDLRVKHIALHRSWFKKGAGLAIGALLTYCVLNGYALIYFDLFVEQISFLRSYYLSGDKVAGSAQLLFKRVVFEFLPFGVGCAGMACLLASTAHILRERIWKYLPCLTACLLPLLLLSSSRGGFVRTLFLALPWFAVSAALLISKYAGDKPKVLKAVYIACLVACVAQASGFYRYALALDTRQIAKSYIESTVPRDSTVLIEGVFKGVIDTCPKLNESVRSLQEKRDRIVQDGGRGGFNLIQQGVAKNDPKNRYRLLEALDCADDCHEMTDRADYILLCKHPHFVERAHDLPERTVIQLEKMHDSKRASLIAKLESAGFREMKTFKPTLVSRWSYIDRPDPRTFSFLSWLEPETPYVGTSIVLYGRSDGIFVN